MMQKKLKTWGSFEGTSLSANMEDYLESIAIIAAEKKVVRVKDIAGQLNITMPSVTNALDRLKKKGLIHYEKYGFIELTRKGKKLATAVYTRHSFLADFFTTVLKLNKKNADDEACKIEHHLSSEALRQIEKFATFYKSELSAGKEWTLQLSDLLNQRPMSDLKEGDTALITKVEGTGNIKKRLLEMGFRKGIKITIVKYAPLRDPILIQVKDYQISLRIKEAQTIIVKLPTDGQDHG